MDFDCLSMFLSFTSWKKIPLIPMILFFYIAIDSTILLNYDFFFKLFFLIHPYSYHYHPWCEHAINLQLKTESRADFLNMICSFLWFKSVLLLTDWLFIGQLVVEDAYYVFMSIILVEKWMKYVHTFYVCSVLMVKI